jgi:hypothetical protein
MIGVVLASMMIIAATGVTNAAQTPGQGGHRVTLIPDKKITRMYNLQEWIFTQMNWYYETYDMDSFRVRTGAGFPIMASGTRVFINDVPYHNRRLLSDYHSFPQINIEAIDSIVVQSGLVVERGLYAPEGAIFIYTSQLPIGFMFRRAGFNQIDDPGLAEFNDMQTPNVEYVKKDKQLIVSVPRLLNALYIYNYDIYSRTDLFKYDGELNRDMFYRNLSFVSYENFERWPFHTNISRTLLNSSENRSVSFQSIIDYTKSVNYEWFDVAGVEIPSHNKHIQGSTNLDFHYFPIIRSFSAGFSHQLFDTIPNRNHLYKELNETTHWQTIGWSIPVGSNSVTGTLHSETMFWSSPDTDARTRSQHLMATAGIPIGRHSIWAGVGNLNGFIQYNWTPFQNAYITASAIRNDLRSMGYTYNLWSEGIGFTGLSRERHQLDFQSDMVDRYLQISAQLNRNLQKINWSIMTEFRHYANLVVQQTEYQPFNSYYPLETVLRFKDAKEAGILFSVINASWIAQDSRLTIRSSAAMHQRVYGPEIIGDFIKRTPRWAITGQVQYRLHQNARLELHYRYLSERFYPEFTAISEIRGFPALRGRPMHVVSATSRNYFMDERITLEIVLRNLLNQTEAYNTNGQYYNMSIGLTLTVHARQRRAR